MLPSLPNEIQTQIINYVDFEEAPPLEPPNTEAIYDIEKEYTGKMRFVATILPHLLFDIDAIENMFPHLFVFEQIRHRPKFPPVQDNDERPRNRHSWAQMIADCFRDCCIDR
jgi:hypothetical protein